MEIDILDVCETINCINPAKKLTSTESKLIQVCLDCFNRKYATIKLSETDSYLNKNNTYEVTMPHVIKNFFSDSELETCKLYIKSLLINKKFVQYSEEKKKENYGSWVINHFVGRINIMLSKNDIPDIFIQILEKHKNEINKNSKLDAVEIVIYSNLYGNPRIDPHIDPPSKRDFMLNIQIDSNIRWPIVEYIDKKESKIILENNECLVMDVTKYVHWRSPIKMQDGDYTVMIFAYFDDENRKPYPSEWYPHPPEWKSNGMPIHNEFTEEISRVYGDDHKDYDKIKQRVLENSKSIIFYNPIGY